MKTAKIQEVYLDYAAATPVSEPVLQAMLPFFTDQFENPSALYGGARSVKAELDLARARSGRALGAQPSEIIFTAGATESINLAIDGVMGQYPGANVIVSAVEHDAVLRCVERYGDTRVCPVDGTGLLLLEKLKSLIDDQTVLVSVMYANNEIGTVQPIKDISVIVDEARRARARSGNKRPLYLHTDAAQAPLYLDCNVARLGIDLMSLNGGKIYGPKQSGILYVRSGIVIQPQIRGGGQEFGLRSGTENIAAAAGFSVALEAAQSGRVQAVKQLQEQSLWLRRQLEHRYGAQLHGHPKRRLPNNVHVSFAGSDNERVLFALDEVGVSAAAGSACSASTDEESHVLRAIGVADADARASIRFSLGATTTREQLEYLVEHLAAALKA